jgi:formate dehydrogenase (coenzyme F420) beta subunit
MQSETDTIRRIAGRLLEDHQVDLVIGYERGSLPLRSTPSFARTASDVEKLIWDATCENNLIRFLRTREGKTAIVVKGCDAGSLVSLIKEKQIERDQVYIIGVPCQGVIDRKLVSKAVGGKEIWDTHELDNLLIIEGPGFEERVSKEDILYISCKSCRHKIPLIYDELVTEPFDVDETVDEYESIVTFEKKAPEERWSYFMDEVSRCIRCYACRNVCPLCYCNECIVDCAKPHWIGKTTNLSDNAIFHIIRAFHTACRCTDCGACVRSCPMGIDLRMLTKKMEMDIQDLFDYRAGESLEAPSPLTTYNLDDPQEFIW